MGPRVVGSTFLGAVTAIAAVVALPKRSVNRRSPEMEILQLPL